VIDIDNLAKRRFMFIFFRYKLTFNANKTFKKVASLSALSLKNVLCLFYVRGRRLHTAKGDPFQSVNQLLAHGRWFSPGTLASSTTKTGRHDIAEILLKVALKHKKSKSNLMS
jgi:hypothetical protein